MKPFVVFFSMLFLCGTALAEPVYNSIAIFPPQDKHVHGSSLVELPNGDLLAAWFHGSGERTADDVLIQGARLNQGDDGWGEVTVLADTPGFPDCNPVYYLDSQERLWLFWIAVRAHGWEHSLLRYKTTTDLSFTGAPEWDWQEIIWLKPGDRFAERMVEGLHEVGLFDYYWAEHALNYATQLESASKNMNYRQEGWMTRNHPIELASGRFLLPLYSDGFNCSLVAISDDHGKTWRPSEPLVGVGGIQPTIVQKKNGDLVAYMRETGDKPYRTQISHSTDEGETWSVVQDTDMPNPSSSMQVLALSDGKHWIMVHNDTEEDRGSLAISLSDDEGETWKWMRHIGRTEYYAYPSMIESRDGMIHISYSHRSDAGRTIRHDMFSLDWVKAGD